MSNIYIQEPPTSGKVLLVTSVGDIDIELWARETPKASRNFIQLCLEGYYDGTIFHRLVKGFIVQGGDPSGTGQGGESCYGEPFKDEFHSRLRFNRRGLLAMANAGKDDNCSQFFFTLGPAPELQNKHTIFGKVVGDTLYNMLKLAEGLVDADERPHYPQKVLRTEVLSNPFPDIIPRALPKMSSDLDVKEMKSRDKRAAVKNFKLLSFGDEAEDDEEETLQVTKQLAAKGASGKSSHDLLQDPSLSTKPAVSVEEKDLSGDESEMETLPGPTVDEVRNKLLSISNSSKRGLKRSATNEEVEEKGDLSSDNDTKEETQVEQLKRLRQEYIDLKAQIRAEKKANASKESDKNNSQSQEDSNKEEESSVLKQFEEQRDKYRSLQEKLPRKGASREQFTLQMLAKFQKKLAAAKDAEVEKEEESESKVDEDTDDSGWLTHKLQFDKGTPILAKDASTKDDDWFEIYDPRNPINKRRRETSRDKGPHDTNNSRDSIHHSRDSKSYRRN